MSRPYLDYYSKYNISPVLNDDKLDLVFKHRHALYYRLGLPAGAINNKEVIEFGPGNGIHALYTFSCQPKEYILVDGNNLGVENCKNNFSKYYPGHQNYKVVQSYIEEYPLDKQFDVVLCEALLCNQLYPANFAKQVSRFVKPGGVYVITCEDVVSNFSEILRGVLGSLLISNKMSFEEQVTCTADFFSSHLAHLKNMTRSYKDWVIDNILHEEYWKDCPMFSIAEAIEALKNDFTIYHTSPVFINDWRWYKDVDNLKQLNQHALESYWENVHNFFDYRFVFPPRTVAKNQLFYNLCWETRQLSSKLVNERTPQSIAIFVDKLRELQAEVQTFSRITADSIANFIEALQQYAVNSQFSQLDRFEPWWGKGMQFVSLIKD